MAALMHTAALSVMHSHTSAGLHQNLAIAVSMSRGGPVRSNKLSHSSFGSPPSSRFGTSLDKRQSSVCNSSMSFNNGLPVDQPFSENDDDYVDSTVLEAVEVKSGPEGFIIKMRDGRYLKCEHNSPETGHLPDYGPQPAIVLQMNDSSKLLLPIIVMELPSIMLIEAVRNVQVVRPTVYHVMKDMIEVMGYQAKMVRVTRRVHEAYYARVYFTKVGDESQEMVSLDLRPSDAINLAVRCNIPIQVNRWLAEGDGVHVVTEPVKLPARALRSPSTLMLTALDRADAVPCAAAEEFVLVRSMMIAAVEERYSDAAKLRDELRQLRNKKKRSRQQKQL